MDLNVKIPGLLPNIEDSIYEDSQIFSTTENTESITTSTVPTTITTTTTSTVPTTITTTTTTTTATTTQKIDNRNHIPRIEEQFQG